MVTPLPQHFAPVKASLGLFPFLPEVYAGSAPHLLLCYVLRTYLARASVLAQAPLYALPHVRNRSEPLEAENRVYLIHHHVPTAEHPARHKAGTEETPVK